MIYYQPWFVCFSIWHIFKINLFNI